MVRRWAGLGAIDTSLHRFRTTGVGRRWDSARASLAAGGRAAAVALAAAGLGPADGRDVAARAPGAAPAACAASHDVSAARRRRRGSLGGGHEPGAPASRP